jgi:agmatine deiminase
MAAKLDGVPAQDGFRMPGEFERHTGCWMLWPERLDNWRDGAKPAQRAFAAVAAAVAKFERVTMGVSAEQFAHARELLPERVRVVELAHDDAWMRDCGPTFLVNESGVVRGVDWDFNAWGGLKGGLYFPWDQDDLVARKVLEIERLDRYKADLVLEGGSFHVDGQGTCLTTEECLLNPNRNPGLTKAEIERRLREYLNVELVIWLGRGVAQDETSGHVDNLCCFVCPGVLALTWTDDVADEQHEISCEAYERLAASRDARGRPFEIHKIHQPAPIRITEAESGGVEVSERCLPREAGQRLAASYVNFYAANGGIVAPVFDDPHDEAALATLRSLFPDRSVVSVPVHEILLGGGGIHCITLQQPQGEPG